MSIGSHVPKSKKMMKVKLTAHSSEIWAAAGAYSAMRDQARLCGFDDMVQTLVTVEVTLVGFKDSSSTKALFTRLEMLELADMEVIGEEDIHDAYEPEESRF